MRRSFRRYPIRRLRAEQRRLRPIVAIDAALMRPSHERPTAQPAEQDGQTPEQAAFDRIAVELDRRNDPVALQDVAMAHFDVLHALLFELDARGLGRYADAALRQVRDRLTGDGQRRPFLRLVKG